MVLIDEQVLIAGQIRAADVTEAAALGVTMIVNSRPDGEEPGQPPGAEIEAAARAGGIAPGQAEAMAAILDEAEGKVLAFCRSGTRSTYLWALARRLQGVDGETLSGQAAAAGYDLAPLRPYLG
jgi:uncharacterized protein (TIGR01244 family)